MSPSFRARPPPSATQPFQPGSGSNPNPDPNRTKEFQFETLERFVENVGLYMAGQELIAVCDKRSGY